MQNRFNILNCDHIVAPVAVVPNIPSSILSTSNKKRKNTDEVNPRGGYFVVSNYSQWADFFTNDVIMS